MADIQQAAKWLQEGKKVVRRRWTGSAYVIHSDGLAVLDQDCDFQQFTVEELLAEDWVIAEPRKHEGEVKP